MNSSEKPNVELICVIVNYGMGSKVLKLAKKIGLAGGTVFLGMGTARNKVLKFLDLSDVRKEVVFIITKDSNVDYALEEFNKKFSFEKPNHGIAFSSPVISFIGSRKCNLEAESEKTGGEKNMSNAIFVVVERGKAELVIDVATKAGSRGGTIINARGSGIHETQTFFAMNVEPEKEIVIILAEKNLTEKIIEAVKGELKIEVAGNGVMFVLDVNRTYGLY